MKKCLPFLPGFGIALVGVLVVVIPGVLLPICEAEPLGWVTSFRPTMRCFWMGQAVILLGCCVVVAGIVLLIRLNRDTGFAIGLLLLALGAALILVSLNAIIGSVCGHQHSPCQVGTKPGVRLAGGLICLYGLGLWLWSLKRQPAR